MKTLTSIIYSSILPVICFGAVNYYGYNGMIAGNKSVEECVNGQRKAYSDLDITTSEMIRKEGYPAEDHLILTEDGYLLTMHRIPGSINSPTIFLHHGVLLSSFDWVVLGKNRALAFLLADEGYDVWMGNARGSLYSRCHIKYTTDDYKYWDFSFHQMGVLDLPAELKYIQTIKSDNFIYVGHSMGTTIFYVMASERPDTASNIKAMFSLAPVAFLDHTTTPLRYLVPFRNIIELVVRLITKGELLSQSYLWKVFVKYGCDLFPAESKLCTQLISLFFEINPNQFDYEKAPLILNHFPSGTSTRTILHYAQIISSHRFENFDHGSKENLKLYNSTEPPSYNLSAIQVPIGMFWSDHDELGNPKDEKHLYNLLPNTLFNYEVPVPGFEHLDHVWGMDAPEFVYQVMLKYMKTHLRGEN